MQQWEEILLHTWSAVFWELEAPVKGRLTRSSWHEERPSFGWDRQFPPLKCEYLLLFCFLWLGYLSFCLYSQFFWSFPYMGSMGNLSFPFNHHLPSTVFYLPWYFSSGAASTSQSACSICGFLVCKKQHYSNNRRSLSGGRGRRGRCDSWFHSTVFTPQPWLQWLRIFFKAP